MAGLRVGGEGYPLEGVWEGYPLDAEWGVALLVRLRALYLVSVARFFSSSNKGRALMWIVSNARDLVLGEGSTHTEGRERTYVEMFLMVRPVC